VAASALTPSTLRGAPFTTVFMAICAVVFGAGLASVNAQQQIFLYFSQINLAVGAGQWWRIFTSAFLHSSPAHIAFNMWALYQFGPPLERQVGSLAFGAMCLACAAWGGATAYMLTGPRSALVGASGAIFGVFGIWLYASYLSRETPMGQARFRNLMTQLVINAVLSFTIPRISWQGHAGGLTSGILIAAVWRQLPQPATSLSRALVAAVAAAVAVAVVLVFPE
jgi:membrane associated rhomboid family serine protease